jgi:CRISPR/Cas system CSM-associated protein Csm2 small subunit
MWINFRKGTYIKIGIHILAWLVLLIFPFFQLTRESDDFNRIMASIWLPLILYAIIFYINYFLFIDKVLFKKKYLNYTLINCLIIMFFLWIIWQFRDLFMNPEMLPMMGPGKMSGPLEGLSSVRKMPLPPRKLFILKDLFSFIIPVIFSLAVRATENWITMESEKAEIEKRNLESELQHLRYQLQPHFFFNSLNNIYSLVDISPPKAQEAIHSLSKLMRYLLYDTGREKVELSQEISFLEKYIQLMELRQTDKTKTTFSFPDVTNTQYQIAPLLFIPLIENAYKHCTSATQLSNISFKTIIEGNQLIFLSENTNFPKNDSDKSGSGIGLENLKKRLDLLYPHKYEFEYGKRDMIFWVRLKIEID